MREDPETIEDAFIACLFDEKYCVPSSDSYVADHDFVNVVRVFMGLQPLATDNRRLKREKKKNRSGIK